MSAAPHRRDHPALCPFPARRGRRPAARSGTWGHGASAAPAPRSAGTHPPRCGFLPRSEEVRLRAIFLPLFARPNPNGGIRPGIHLRREAREAYGGQTGRPAALPTFAVAALSPGHRAAPHPPARAALLALSCSPPLAAQPPGSAAPRAAVALRRGPFSAGRARGRRRCQAAGRRTTAHFPLLLLTRPEPSRGAEGRAAARRGGSGALGRKAPSLPAETPRRLVRRPGREERREEGRRRRGRARAATPRWLDATVAYRPRLRSAPHADDTSQPGRRRAPVAREEAPQREPGRGRPQAPARGGASAPPHLQLGGRRRRTPPRAAPPPPRAAAAPRSARVLLPRTSLAASGEPLLPLAAASREVGRLRRAIGRASCVYTRRPPIRGISARRGGAEGRGAGRLLPGQPRPCLAPRPAGAGREARSAGLGSARPAPPAGSRSRDGKRLEVGAACSSRSANANGKRWREPKSGGSDTVRRRTRRQQAGLQRTPPCRAEPEPRNGHRAHKHGAGVGPALQAQQKNKQQKHAVKQGS